MSNFKESLSQTIRKQLHERAVREYQKQMLLREWEDEGYNPTHVYDQPMPGQDVVNPPRPGFGDSLFYPHHGQGPHLPYHPIFNPFGYQSPRPGSVPRPKPTSTPGPAPNQDPPIWSSPYMKPYRPWPWW